MSPAAETARSLAAAHPAAMLPCPACAVSVKAANLDAHLAKVHPGAPALTAWRGVDRRSIATSVVLLALVMAGSVAVGAGAGVVPGTPDAQKMVAVWGVFALLVVVAASGLPRATLSLDGDVLVLRHSLGLLRRRVRLPCSLTHGPIELLPFQFTHGDHPVESRGPGLRVGWYLRLGGITVGCKASTGFRTHWSTRAWQKGPGRLLVDVMVTPEVMVALEYALAARGFLALDAA